MKTVLRTLLFLAVVVGLIAPMVAKPNLVVALRGTDVATPDLVPDIDGDGQDDEALCFELDLVDLKSGRTIGSATDCLSNVTPVGDGLALVGTTYFHFPEGVLVTRGLTSVKPTTIGSPNFTHVTGAIPDHGENSVLFGTGRFHKASGAARLSGAVNLSALGSDGLITFDCIFVIDLD
jgi:hypothetical protein